MKILSVLAVCAYCVVAEKTKIGDLKNLHHGVSGSVFATDDHTLVIENFNYDGAGLKANYFPNIFFQSFTPGPDAFFWVGTEGSPSNVADEKTLILDPQGQNYKYRDQSAPVLGRSDDEKITLTLPANMKVGDLKWVSVWCRRFTVDFGNLIFPDNLDLPTSEKTLPHPLVPVDDNDVAAEPEPESESEPEPGKRLSLISSLYSDISFRSRPPRPPRPRPSRPRPQSRGC